MIDFAYSTFSRCKSHFANWRDWEMNPIVIKEMRQGVRSWAVTGMLMLFLIVLFLASLGFLITESFDMNANLALGGSMFSTFIVILAGASVFFIPLYTGVRVAAERVENNPDLLYVSTLSPFRIIFGKFLCSAYIALLFFSACMPFMAFTNLLRGVDLPTVFFILFYLFLLVCAANSIAIFLGCLPMSRPFKFLFLIYGVFQSVTLIGSGTALAFQMTRSGIGAMMAQRDFWLSAATATSIFVMISGFFLILAVALISPASANRALSVKLYITAIWIISGLLAFGWAMQSGDGERIYAWSVPTFILMMLTLLVVISNNDQLSIRIRKKIPKVGLKKIFAFIFFNGAAGGLVWVAGILVSTFFVSHWVMLIFPRTSTYSSTETNWDITTSLYAFDYALAAVFIHRKFFPRRPAKWTGLIAVLLAGGWALAPGIFLFFVNRLSWQSIDGFQPGNIFNIFSVREQADQARHEIFAVIGFIVVLAINVNWFIRQIKNFRPPPAVENTPPVLQ